MNFMFYFYFLLSHIFKNIYAPIQTDQTFTTWSCYQSNSSPTQFIEVYSYYPTNPPNLYINFGFILYPLEQDDEPIELQEGYSFKRINGPCISSIIFSTKGLFFTKIYLNISIHFFEYFKPISEVVYTFYNNFNPDFYLLMTKYSDFGLVVQVRYHGLEYIQSKITVFPIDWLYLLNITYGYDDICLITFNNPAVVIRPEHKFKIPNYLILGIIGEYIKNGLLVDKFKYRAFTCQSGEMFPNEFVWFIDEQPPEIELKLGVILLTDFFSTQNNITNYFKIQPINRIHVNKSRNMPSYFKKIYFITFRAISSRFSNESLPISLLTADGIVYYAKELKNINISSHVVGRHYTTSRLFDSTG